MQNDDRPPKLKEHVRYQANEWCDWLPALSVTSPCRSRRKACITFVDLGGPNSDSQSLCQAFLSQFSQPHAICEGQMYKRYEPFALTNGLCSWCNTEAPQRTVVACLPVTLDAMVVEDR